MREERKQELEEHISAVNALLTDAENKPLSKLVEDSSDDEAFEGFADDDGPVLEPIDHEAEYIDEDKYTTVTVESVDVTKEGLSRTAEEGEEEAAKAEARRIREEKEREQEKEAKGKKVWPKKGRKQKFRYESKAERRFTRGKQQASNRKAADARKGKD